MRLTNTILIQTSSKENAFKTNNVYPMMVQKERTTWVNSKLL